MLCCAVLGTHDLCSAVVHLVPQLMLSMTVSMHAVQKMQQHHEVSNS